MKKLIMLLLFLWTSHSIKAQWQQQYKAGVNAGYEWNIFLNPSVIEGEEDILRRADLWQNAFYQGGFFSADFKRNTKTGRFKLGAFFSGANYNSSINANRHAFRLNGSYRTKYAPRKYFEIAPELYRIKRQGINDQDAILNTPFSYLRFTLPFKFDFYLRNKAWLKTAAGYTYKAYDRINNQDIFYHAGFVAGSLSKKWKNRHLETKLTFSSRAEFRFYKNIEQFLDEEEPGAPVEVDENLRLWTYVSNDLVYAIKANSNRYEIKLGLYSTLRWIVKRRTAIWS